MLIRQVLTSRKPISVLPIEDSPFANRTFASLPDTRTSWFLLIDFTRLLASLPGDFKRNFTAIGKDVPGSVVQSNTTFHGYVKYFRFLHLLKIFERIPLIKVEQRKSGPLTKIYIYIYTSKQRISETSSNQYQQCDTLVCLKHETVDEVKKGET